MCVGSKLETDVIKLRWSVQDADVSSRYVNPLRGVPGTQVTDGDATRK
jgi:hypothetical protein